MNWDQLQGKWRQVKGSAKQQWGKFTDDDLEYIAGHRESLIGKLQERYGWAKEEAQKKADEWMKSMPATEQKAASGAASHAPQHDYQETGKR
jgi:uncharacterized protein YjbJ (UPF0337 family)